MCPAFVTPAALAETVKAVLDGDTLLLSNQQRIRLIGIDTPEIGHKSRPSQPFARQAKNHLQTLLKNAHHTVRLELDAQATDRYDRTLAHVFLPDGSNLNEAMLRAGLATLFLYPPNLKYADQYAQAEALARQQNLKRWKYLNTHVKAASRLRPQDAGITLVTGKVSALRHGRHTQWLLLDNKLTLKITNADATRFTQPSLAELVGKTLEIEGKLYFYRGQPRMRLRHPYQMHVTQ